MDNNKSNPKKAEISQASKQVQHWNFPNAIDGAQNKKIQPSNDAEKLVTLKRSQKYLDALRRLDEEDSKNALKVIIEENTDKKTDESLSKPILVGILSKCYLSGHDVHKIDAQGKILCHYHKFEVLPDGFEPARSIALMSQIFAVEVYADGTLLGVYIDGQVKEFEADDL